MHFTPAAFVRHVPSKFLQDYFAKRQQLNEIDWEQLSPSDSKLVHEAILQLPATQVREIHGNFRAVWEMAAREYACWLIQVAREHGVDLTVPEQRKSSAYERAFRVFLDHPAVFEQARALAHWENLPRRSTERRNGMPKKAPVVTEVTLEQFAANLSKYYQQAQGRGEHCKVEHFVRGGHLDYFFVYPADYIDTKMCFEDDGSLIRKQWKPAFEVVVLFDRTTGSADLYAEGNADVRENVAGIFARTVLGHEAIPRRIPKPPYDLQPLLNPQFRFPTRPEDRILYIRLKAIRVKRTSDDERVTFEASGRHSRRNAAALLDEGLDEQRWPRESRRVTQVGIQAAFERGPHRPRIVNFTITHPAGCSLRDSEEELILRRCLRDGGIANNE
jgi:hypothetical protein